MYDASSDARNRKLDRAIELVSRGRMRFVTWEDETGLLEGPIAPTVHPRLAPLFDTGRAYLVRGRLRGGRAGARLEVEHLIPFERRGQAPQPSATALP